MLTACAAAVNSARPRWEVADVFRLHLNDLRSDGALPPAHREVINDIHTRDQQLRHHAHGHCVVPGGVLSSDRPRWISARPSFLFPVKALGKLFRGKFIAFLKEAFVKGLLQFPGKTAPLAKPKQFHALLDAPWKKPWVVHAKPPFAGPEKVLDYLGRYTHRVAIAHHRILRVAEGTVSFAFRDRADGNRKKLCTLPAPEFIRRFLLHVLPNGFVRIRPFGFLAPRSKGRDLRRCRKISGLDPQPKAPPEKTTRERRLDLTGIDLALCPQGKQGTMIVIYELEPLDPQAAQRPSPPEGCNSS
jgi:hypothetical protein